jgi:hypothetical protein
VLLHRVTELLHTAVLANGVVAHAPRARVESECIPSTQWSYFTQRRAATMPAHVLCANAASWYRVFDRGKEMGAVSRDYFCSLTISILSSRVGTFFRASFGCSTYTCGCVPATLRHGNLSFSSGCSVGPYVNYHVHYSASTRNGISRFLLVVLLALLYVDYMYTIQCPDIVAIEYVQ